MTGVAEARKPWLTLLSRRSPRIPLTWVLVLVNLAVFMAMLVAGAGLWHPPSGIQLAWGANFGPATQEGQWWRLGSAMFLHFGVVHLLLNLWALWDSGRFVERLFGPARFLIIYFASGLSGNLFSLTLQGRLAVSAGASGAVFGLYGALLVSLWAERDSIDPREFKWMFWGAAGFAVCALTIGAWIPGIDNAAHAGGLIVGLLAGTLLRRPLALSDIFSWRVRGTAAMSLIVLLLVVVFRMPSPAYSWQEEQKARQYIGAFLREEADIKRHWQDIRRSGESGHSFEMIAGRIEAEIVERYDNSFEQLSTLHIDPAAPSAARIEVFRRYAESRREAARGLVRELRVEVSQGTGYSTPTP